MELELENHSIEDVVYLIIAEFSELKMSLISCLSKSTINYPPLSGTKIMPGYIRDGDGMLWYYFQHGYSLCFRKQNRFKLTITIDFINDIDYFSPDSILNYIRTRKNKGFLREALKKISVLEIRDCIALLIEKNHIIAHEKDESGFDNLFKLKDTSEVFHQNAVIY